MKRNVRVASVIVLGLSVFAGLGIYVLPVLTWYTYLSLGLALYVATEV